MASYNTKRNYMRNIIQLSFLIIIALATGACSSGRNLGKSKVIVSPLTENFAVKDGTLIYALPLTVVDLKVEIERVVEKPGPYSRFAGEMLGLTDVIRSENEYWSVTGVTVRTHDELDPSGFYVIEASSLFQTNALSLKKAGLILDLNPEIYYSSEVRYQDKGADLNNLRVLDLGADEYFRSRSDTAYRIISVDTAFIRIPYLIEKKQKLTLEQLADRAARRLMELRDGKHLILTGEANVFPQSDAAINEINRLEKDYTELFAGKTWKEYRTFSFQIIPRKEMIGKQTVLFRFSEMRGPEAASEKAGNPVTIDFLPEEKTGQLNVLKRSGPSSSKFDKLFYRIPDVVTIRISLGKEIITNSRQLIFQFGEVVQLPSNYIIGR